MRRIKVWIICFTVIMVTLSSSSQALAWKPRVAFPLPGTGTPGTPGTLKTELGQIEGTVVAIPLLGVETKFYGLSAPFKYTFFKNEQEWVKKPW